MAPKEEVSQPKTITPEGQVAKVEENMRKWKTLFQTINQRNGVRAFTKYHVANFFFLLVLMGTEMDMAGLFFSAKIYMEYDEIYEYLIVILGAAFVLPLLFVTCLPIMAFCFNGDAGEDAITKWSETVLSAGGEETGAQRLNSFLKRLNPHGGNMMFYHWVPCLRFYLIVKPSYTATDVDAVFRVNSISSFSLGVFQLIGIFATVVLGKEVNLYVKINIATQCLNWFITMCYFGTSVPTRMSVSAQARTISRHFQGILSEFANENAKEVNSVMSGDADLEAQSRKKAMKSKLAELMANKFLPGDGSQPSSSGRDSGSSTPSAESIGSPADLGDIQMRDADAKHFMSSLEKKMSSRAFLEDMKDMRDIDVKDFLVLMRNQTMSVLDVKGGL